MLEPTLCVFFARKFLFQFDWHALHVWRQQHLCVCVACVVCSVRSRVGRNLLYKSPGRKPGWRFTARCKFLGNLIFLQVPLGRLGWDQFSASQQVHTLVYATPRGGGLRHWIDESCGVCGASLFVENAQLGFYVFYVLLQFAGFSMRCDCRSAFVKLSSFAYLILFLTCVWFQVAGRVDFRLLLGCRFELLHCLIYGGYSK